MFFASSHYRNIPIWANRDRIKLLVAFRHVLEEYVQTFQSGGGGYRAVAEYYHDNPAELQRDNPALADRRTWLNQRLPLVYRFVRLTGVNPVIQRYNFRYDLLMNMFNDPTGKDLGLAFDVLDQAIGVYQADKSAAWLRTFWPFFWFGRLADWISEIPFRILRKMGLGPADTSRGLARFFHGIFSLVAWLVGIAASVFGILEFFGFRESLLKLIGRK
jgi:hypothetical protein